MTVMLSETSVGSDQSELPGAPEMKSDGAALDAVSRGVTRRVIDLDAPRSVANPRRTRR